MDETWGLPLTEIGAMTHWPEQPNPVHPIVEAVRKYLQSGDYNPVHEAGTQPADYLRELARNPDILAKNIEQASQFNFGGTIRPTKGSVPLSAIGSEVPALKAPPSIAEQVKGLGGEWASRPVIDAQGNVIHNSITSDHVSGPI